MTRQNVYDDEQFFAEYQSMRATASGLNEALEQPALRALLPELAGLDVVDLGCGDGALGRFMVEQGSTSVLGIDPSLRMLDVATARTNDPRVRYQRNFAEDVRLPARSVDLVVSSLALHYIADLAALLSEVRSWLRPRGAFVASMEHPLITATSGTEGDTTGYVNEGPRHTQWYVSDVVKYHRMISTVVGDLLAAGLVVTALTEPVPSADMLADRPDLAVHRERPPLLLVRGQLLR